MNANQAEAREYALSILPHMRRDILERFKIIRWTDRGLPVVITTEGQLDRLQDWACDNFGYSFRFQAE
jgi:hypothetical protein